MAQPGCVHTSYTMYLFSKLIIFWIEQIPCKKQGGEVQGIELDTYMQKLSCKLLSALSICFLSAGCRQVLTSPKSLLYICLKQGFCQWTWISTQIPWNQSYFQPDWGAILGPILRFQIIFLLHPCSLDSRQSQGQGTKPWESPTLWPLLSLLHFQCTCFSCQPCLLGCYAQDVHLPGSQQVLQHSLMYY